MWVMWEKSARPVVTVEQADQCGRGLGFMAGTDQRGAEETLAMDPGFDMRGRHASIGRCDEDRHQRQHLAAHRDDGDANIRTVRQMRQAGQQKPGVKKAIGFGGMAREVAPSGQQRRIERGRFGERRHRCGAGGRSACHRGDSRLYAHVGCQRTMCR